MPDPPLAGRSTRRGRVLRRGQRPGSSPLAVRLKETSGSALGDSGSVRCPLALPGDPNAPHATAEVAVDVTAAKRGHASAAVDVAADNGVAAPLPRRVLDKGAREVPTRSLGSGRWRMPPSKMFQPKFGMPRKLRGRRLTSSRRLSPTSPMYMSPVALSKENRHGFRARTPRSRPARGADRRRSARACRAGCRSAAPPGRRSPRRSSHTADRQARRRPDRRSGSTRPGCTSARSTVRRDAGAARPFLTRSSSTYASLSRPT